MESQLRFHFTREPARNKKLVTKGIATRSKIPTRKWGLNRHNLNGLLQPGDFQFDLGGFPLESELHRFPFVSRTPFEELLEIRFPAHIGLLD